MGPEMNWAVRKQDARQAVVDEVVDRGFMECGLLALALPQLEGDLGSESGVDGRGEGSVPY